MERTTILKPTGCDLTKLPLGAVEAFVLSQLDGLLTLEEIAVVCSLELRDATRIAVRLVDLGAACKSDVPRSPRDRRGRRGGRIAIEEDARSVVDPRSEQPSVRPTPTTSKPSSRPDARPSARPDRPSPKPSRRPPAGEPAAVEAGSREKSPERRRSSRGSLRMQRISSRRIKAVKKTTPPPTARTRTERPASSVKDGASPAGRKVSARPPAAPNPATTDGSPGTRTEPSLERLRKLQTAAKEIEVQSRVQPLLLAAEEALKTNDVISAANNYRLALQHRDDPFIRIKLEEVDRLAKAVRVQRSVACARAAEDDGRWADAALHFTRAHETKPTAELADRAANALRLGMGDLERAAALAEQAVSLDPKNVRYRVTLGEVYLAAKLLTRAGAQAETALELAPKDPRGQELAAAIARAKKEKT